MSVEFTRDPSPSDEVSVDEDDIKALTASISRLTTNLVQRMAQDTVPALVKGQVEQTLENIVPEALNAAIASQMGTLVEQGLKTIVPGLVEAAIAEERVLIKETAQEVARQIRRSVVSVQIHRVRLGIGKPASRRRRWSRASRPAT